MTKIDPLGHASPSQTLKDFLGPAGDLGAVVLALADAAVPLAARIARGPLAGELGARSAPIPTATFRRLWTSMPTRPSRRR